ncbi:Abi-alpha family protein [Conexibacter sp. SYSU D00693]|uniref:Abi-alpha family protein n=1 Tax=Conexibacter sp. SYSU D00693 TaxID=2812560 RepID=UPI00196B463A|nr:Abi-alpha family protein [Conexibacter sp. SYSU D00693]
MERRAEHLEDLPPLDEEAAGPDGRGSAGAEPADLLRLAPGLARLAGEAYLRTVGWTLTSGVKATARVARAATRGESVGHLLSDAEHALREQARNALGVADLDERVARVAPRPVFDRNGNGNGAAAADDALPTLRDLGAQLLARSADVDAADDPVQAHPAYARILEELAPDEARILRLLAAEGAQPAVDVKTWRPLDIGAQTMAPGITMIGSKAGCRYVDRVPAYLNNLFRLGLIWFSREALEDPLAYQVLEAQPEVTSALKRAGRGKTVRRQILLTPFGADFCRVCLP